MNNPACRGLRSVTSPGRIDAGARIESSSLRFLGRTALLLPPQRLFIVSDRPVSPPVRLFFFTRLNGSAWPGRGYQCRPLVAFPWKRTCCAIASSNPRRAGRADVCPRSEGLDTHNAEVTAPAGGAGYVLVRITGGMLNRADAQRPTQRWLPCLHTGCSVAGGCHAA
jgi:hypothetical protein